MQIKTTMRYITSHRSEWPSSKNLQTVIVEEDVEKREPSYTVSGDVNGTATMENSMAVPQKTRVAI